MSNLTCRHTMSLLEDYLDNNLKSSETSKIETHLEACKDCQQEFQDATHLRNILKQVSNPVPPDDYWGETTQLILARTIETSKETQTESVSNREVAVTKMAFGRALAAFAVSLVVLSASLYISFYGQDQSTTTHHPSTSIFRLTDSSGDSLSTERTTGISKQDQTRLAGSMMLIGSPGMLDKTSILTDLLITKKK